MSSELTATCNNYGYGALTILISIVDEITDIIILINFYNQDRTTFFIISLVILILSHLSYAIIFTISFDISYYSIIIFCCLLPFGPLIAFIIYLIGNHQKERYNYWFKRFIGCSLSADYPSFGFIILQPIMEAMPQSILQIVAVTYFKETDVICIVSILLSICSVMSRSWIFWKQTDTYTFIWMNLSIHADIFYIFLLFTWIFYSNDGIITAEYFGCFNVFGRIWFWKFLISACVPVGIVGIDAFRDGIQSTLVYFGILMNMLINDQDGLRWVWCLGLICFVPLTVIAFIVMFIIAVSIAVFIALLIEVVCYSAFAAMLHRMSAKRILYLDDDEEDIDKVTTEIIKFISNGTSDKDTIIRILAVNYGLNQCDEREYHCSKLCEYIDETTENGEYDKLEEMTFSGIREIASPLTANFYKTFVFEQLFDALGFGIINWILLFSKCLQILYPWIIVGYLMYYDLLFTNQIDIFPKIILMICVALQFSLLVLGVYVGRIHHLLWHIEPGNTSINWLTVNLKEMRKEVQLCYDDVCWHTTIRRIICNRFGEHVGSIIMEYSIQQRVFKQFVEVDHSNSHHVE